MLWRLFHSEEPPRTHDSAGAQRIQLFLLLSHYASPSPLSQPCTEREKPTTAHPAVQMESPRFGAEPERERWLHGEQSQALWGPKSHATQSNAWSRAWRAGAPLTFPPQSTARKPLHDHAMGQAPDTGTMDCHGPEMLTELARGENKPFFPPLAYTAIFPLVQGNRIQCPLKAA